MSVVVVTHLVTHPPSRRGGGGHGPGTSATDRPGDADVVRRHVERRAPQLVMVAAARDEEMTHAQALRGGFPRWRTDAGLPSDC
jgi:hypothetical protein